MARHRDFNSEEVIDKSIDVFLSQGFEATAIKDIAGLTEWSLAYWGLGIGLNRIFFKPRSKARPSRLIRILKPNPSVVSRSKIGAEVDPDQRILNKSSVRFEIVV